MNNSKIIIYGNGAHSEMISFYFNNESNYKICGYCIENNLRNEVDNFNNQPLIDFETIEDLFPSSEYSLFIAVGNNYIRERIFSESKKKGYSMISHISPNSLHHEDLTYGENVFVTESCCIQPFVEIGNNTFITGSKIGHHSKIGNHVLLSCTKLGGNVKVGNYSFLGLNSAINNNIEIAEKNIIGMGCNIVKSTNSNEVYTTSHSTIKRDIAAEKIKYKYM